MGVLQSQCEKSSLESVTEHRKKPRIMNDDVENPSLPAAQLANFVNEGFLLFQLSEKEVPAALHKTVYRRAGELYSRRLGNNVYPEISELGDVLAAPTLVAALETVLGPGYCLHRHRHLHVSRPEYDQPWHKDSYWGWRRMRNHRPRWAMVMYYPQDTVLDMGPTALLPGSQYLTVDHEQNSMVGEDYLSAHGMKTTSDDVNAHLAKSLEPSLKERFVIAKAGSVALIHYDLFHRGSRVRATGLGARYMFKFQFYRVREPVPGSLPAIGAVGPESMRIVHEETLRWLGAQSCSPELAPCDEEMERYQNELRSSSELVRIAAAYRLGRVARDARADTTRDAALLCLSDTLNNDREDMRRAASFGLVAAGAAAESLLTAALGPKSRAPEAARKYALWALGEIDTTSPEAAETLLDAVANANGSYLDECKEVLAKATAISSLGLLAQRAHRIGNAKLFNNICAQLSIAAGNAERDDDVGDLFREEATLSLLLACDTAPEWASAQPRLVSLLARLLDDDGRYIMGYAAQALLSLAKADCGEAVCALQTALSADGADGLKLQDCVQRRRCPHTTPRSEY